MAQRPQRRRVVVGVDTHAAVHCAAVIDDNGRLLGCAEFAASATGYHQLLGWARTLGRLDAAGIEGSGAYGAGLARHLAGEGVIVLEVPRPDRRLRRNRGKSDPLDAEAAARAVLAGTATVAPKLADGPVEAIRALRIAKLGAIKAKTAATNTLRAMIITAPEPLRAQLASTGLPNKVINACLCLRPDPSRLCDPVQATKAALRSVALRAKALREELQILDGQLGELVAVVAPHTLATFAMGIDTTSALLVTIGDNPDRLRSEAAFARLCGVAPIPASSGKTNRHRLHRGGDRSANRALHIATVVRMRYNERTRAYVARRTADGLSKPEIIRCLKRYLAREIFQALRADYSALASPT
jgi:transposase